jgi:hypothetical protein
MSAVSMPELAYAEVDRNKTQTIRRKPSSALPDWSSGYMPTGLAGRAPERVRRHRTNSSGPQAIDTAGKSTA